MPIDTSPNNSPLDEPSPLPKADSLVAAFRCLNPGPPPCPNHPSDAEPWDAELRRSSFHLEMDLFQRVMAVTPEDIETVTADFWSAHADDLIHLYDPANLAPCPLCGAMIPARYKCAGGAV